MSVVYLTDDVLNDRGKVQAVAGRNIVAQDLGHLGAARSLAHPLYSADSFLRNYYT